MRRLGFSSQSSPTLPNIKDRDVCSTVACLVTAGEACCRLKEGLTAMAAVSQRIQLAQLIVTAIYCSCAALTVSAVSV